MTPKNVSIKFIVCITIATSQVLTSCNAQRNDSKMSGQLFSQAEGSPISTNCASGNIAFGDINSDGKPDLITTCGQTKQIILLAGNGKGQFQILGVPIAVHESPDEIAIADMNSDKKQDIILASHDSYNVTILSGDGKGGFTVSSNSPVIMRTGSHPHTHGLAISDFNKDGNPDIVTANNEDNDVAVALGNGSGGFTKAESSPFAVDQSPYPLVVGDVNNDSNPDIVATSTRQGGKSGNALTLLLGDGLGGFKTSKIPVRTINPGYVSIGDINGDKRPDIVATHLETSELSILLGDGSEKFTETASSPFNLGQSAWGVAIKDINNDGRPDVLAAAGNGIRIMLGDGQGGFSPAPGSPFATGGGAWRFAIGDLNTDNHADIATSNMEGKTVTVLLGNK